jgi:hypothetical protein
MEIEKSPLLTFIAVCRLPGWGRYRRGGKNLWEITDSVSPNVEKESTSQHVSLSPLDFFRRCALRSKNKGRLGESMAGVGVDTKKYLPHLLFFRQPGRVVGCALCSPLLFLLLPP